MPKPALGGGPATLWLAGIAALVTLAYWPGLGGGFVFDDYPNIVMNPGVHVTTLSWEAIASAAASSPANDLPRPIAMLSFAMDHWLLGLDPRAMKSVNLLIHVANALLVFLLLARLHAIVAPGASRMRATGFSGVVATAWALAPINLMPVLLIVQRMESLSHLFVFGGLLLYLVGRSRMQREADNGVLLAWSGVLVGLIGTGAKESAALVPLYALAVEILFRAQEPTPRAASRALRVLFVAMLLLPAIAGLAWLLPKVMHPGAFHGRNFGLAERLITEGPVLVDYLRWTLLPQLDRLSLFHDDYPVYRSLFDPTVMGSLAILSLMAVVGFTMRRRNPLFSLGIVWFFSAHLLTATIIPLELVFEHRNYFSSLGLLLSVGSLLAPAGRPVAAWALAVGILLVGFYGVNTHLRAREWDSPLRFALAERAKHPQSPRATYNAAQVLALASGADRESPLFPVALAAFNQASQVPGAGISPYQGALLLSARSGLSPDPALWQGMQRRLRQRPPGVQDRAALASLTQCAIRMICRFPRGEMLGTFEAALSTGADPEVMSQFANYVLNVMGDSKFAATLWQEAASIDPSEPEYAIAVAKVSLVNRDYDVAQSEIARLRELRLAGRYRKVADSLQRDLDRMRETASSPAP